MKKLIWIITGGTIFAVLIVFAIVFFIVRDLSTTLEVRVLDAVSKSWVYNTTIRLQNRVIRGFKSLSYTFKNIKTGRYELSVSAPYYESKQLQITIHPGKNTLPEPVELTGYMIPELDSISIFENKQENDMFIDIRLIGKDGHAVIDHPCLPIIIITRISVQLVNDEYDYYNEGMKLQKGKLLYFGEADWTWNTGLTETYRYSASIPLEKIAVSPAPYWIMEYLVLLPNPLLITREQLEQVVQKVYSVEDIEVLTAFLQGLKGTVDYYLNSKPNVENLFGGTK